MFSTLCFRKRGVELFAIIFANTSVAFELFFVLFSVNSICDVNRIAQKLAITTVASCMALYKYYTSLHGATLMFYTVAQRGF